ncbi:hypothetical protein EVAR_67521_1 [Eumeta japonica]|uniref:Uncharacterized protein n=1 Tax=Eumeta variegata TaxID=151549 RepID=A0A4C1YU02_EUMVA|nr:hypothetical protein EVAR_67521_1 [Eumeta japonica]
MDPFQSNYSIPRRYVTPICGTHLRDYANRSPTPELDCGVARGAGGAGPTPIDMDIVIGRRIKRVRSVKARWKVGQWRRAPYIARFRCARADVASTTIDVVQRPYIPTSPNDEMEQILPNAKNSDYFVPPPSAHCARVAESD